MSLDRELAKLQEITVPFEVKSEVGTTLLVRGVAVTYETDLQGESFDPTTTRAAFERYVQTSPTVALEHDQTFVLGRIVEAVYTPRGIEVVAEIPKPAPSAPPVLLKAYELVKAGILKAFSIGGRWRRLPGEVEKLFPIQIVETSIAFIGVNPEAVFEVMGTKSLGDSDLDAALNRLADLTASALDRELAALRAL